MSDKYPGGLITTGAPAGFSVAFDGTGDYLTWSGSTVGAGVFTFECWFYANNFSASQSLFGPNGTTNGGFGFNVASSTSISIDRYGVSADNFTVPTMSTNTWYHIAVVRNASNATTVFLNGVRSSTGTTTIAYTFGNVGAIGYTSSAVNRYFNGYISNARYVAAVVYDPTTTTINVPTQLFPIASTVLLACQSPTIIDNSTNNFTITANGDAKVSNFTPFAGYTGFNPALGAAAGGVWTLDQAAYYQNNRKWPIYDPYFNQTTLMLHGNGTNAAQNNTFLDSSTNNFTITRNGNTTQGTFTPFSQTGWSTYFNGSTDYLLPASNAALTLGTGDFSINMWLFPTVSTGTTITSVFGIGGAVTGSFQIYTYFPGGSPNTVSINSTSGTLVHTTGTLTVNAWNYLAISRTSGKISAFLNGANVLNNATFSDNLTQTSSSIGRSYYNLSQEYFSGYVSDLRVIKGTALYSGTGITVPTAPSTAITGTSLLTCQNNRFVDNSANNIAITTGGTPTVQAFSPFVPAYITPTTYSNYFDGSGDYFYTPSSANLALGTGDFTVEFWIYAASLPAADSNILNQNLVSGTPQFYIDSSGKLQYRNAFIGAILTSTQTFTAGKWYYCSVARASGTARMFINGVLETSAADTTNWSNTAGWYVSNNTNSFNGCISNVRIVKGTALYTASYTPPTSPLTAITNTQLLTCQNSTFVDNSSNAFALTTAGNVQPVTSPTPFPAKVDQTTLNSAYSTSLIGGSAYFDGTGDYLTAPNNTALQLGSSDFTIEGWVYVSASSASLQTFIAKGTGAGNQASYAIQLNTSNQWTYYLSGNGSTWSIASGVFMGGVSLNSWNHVALVRSGSTFTPYVNGISGTTTTSATALFSGTAVLSVGSDDAAASRLTGYVAGSRVIKGTALYTSNFAPPIAPPTPVTNTQLLLNYTNAGIYDNTAKNVFETVGNAQISTTQSKYGGSSMYFDGSGDWLQALSTPQFNFGTGNFTLECWAWLTNFSTDYRLLAKVVNIGSYGSWQVIVDTSGYPRFYASSAASSWDVCSNLGGGVAIVAGTWNHIAVTRSGTTFTIWVNGVSAGTTTSSASIYYSASVPVTVGGMPDGTRSLNGYIDDARITTGVARYTTNFTPPTSQLQDQ